VVESATDYAIFSIDPDGLVTSWNNGAERVLGFVEEEIVGRSADVIFPPEEGGGDAAREEREVALREGRAEDERWQMRKDGTRFWASGLLMPLADPRLGFVKILRDRTERHEADARLAENEARFRLLATNIPQLVFRTRSNGSRSWGSPQWCAFTGLNLDQSLEFGWLDAVHPDDREETLAGWREAERTGAFYAEHRIRSAATGDYRWHQTRARPVQQGSDDWVGTATDVHDLRGLQERQLMLMAELQHRTRNLLAVVQSVANQTLRGSATLQDFRTEFQGRLRALGRVQALLARADFQDIELRELILAELRAYGDEDPDRLRIEGPPVALPVTSIQALGLAVHELTTNAVKYGALAQSSGRLHVSWSVEPKPAAPRLTLRWIESGVTMPPGGRPERTGYGSELIERALPYQLGADTQLEFGPDGVRCAITVPLQTEETKARHG
jgi:PAS domain S-box-containing protein